MMEVSQPRPRQTNTAPRIFRLPRVSLQKVWLIQLLVPLSRLTARPTLPVPMATPFLVGIGAIGAALAGRHLIRTGVIRIGAGAAKDQWVKGGFKAKMDRKEAIEILALKCVSPLHRL